MGAHLERKEVALIGAAAFARCCKEAKSDPVVLQFSTSEVKGNQASIDVINIPTELQEFADVFDEGLSDELAPHRPYDLKIELEEGAMQPKPAKGYPLSPNDQKLMDEFLDKALEDGIIQISNSSYAAPIFLVKKPGTDEKRPVIDYRALNAITNKN